MSKTELGSYQTTFSKLKTQIEAAQDNLDQRLLALYKKAVEPSAEAGNVQALRSHYYKEAALALMQIRQLQSKVIPH